jgi:pilus assembly protein CpaE
MTTRVLAVDDDPINLKLVSMTLSQEGYKVFTAASGDEALSQVDEIQPNLVILDVSMPGMDGYEVCRRMRRKSNLTGLPIMMLTANDTLEQKVKGFEAGADDYMIKPFQMPELKVRVQALLRRASVVLEPQSPTTESKVIAVFSLRGGVGVSTVATNLALGLTQIWELPTVLVDLALTCGQSALMLNLSLRNTLADLADTPIDELDTSLVEQVMQLHPSGLRVLTAAATPQQGDTVTGEYVAKALDLLAKRHHYVVVDLPHNFSETTLQALDLAELILAVMSPEMASVYMMKRTLEIFDGLGYDRSKISLVFNRTFEKRGLAQRDIEKALGQQVGFLIPFSPEPLIDALNMGAPIVKSPDVPVGALFEEMAFRLSQEQDRTTIPENPTPAWMRISSRVRQQRK